MAETHLYQIFYSEQTRRELDPGFIPLDNSENARPDWREYWPIRNFLLNQALIESDYYGFFAPTFAAKTRLDAARVRAFVLEAGPEPDAVVFSPMWDMSAFFLNVFEQGTVMHPGLFSAASEFFQAIRPGVQLSDLFTTSRNTAFCNYIAAKPSFWRAWLQIGEELFAAAEKGSGDLAQRLKSPASHGEQHVQLKVFIMERIATFMFSTDNRWKVKAYDPFRLCSSAVGFIDFHLEAVLCDALKIAYGVQPLPEYKDAFHYVRDKVKAHLQTRRKPAAAPPG
jgi:hypothetical protein